MNPVANTILYASWRWAMWKHWNDNNTWQTCATVNRLVSDLEEWIMPQKNGTKEAALSETFYFINCRVDPDAWESIADLYGKSDDVFDLLAELILSEHKVGFGLNGQNGLTTCSITNKQKGSPAFGACLTASADGWYDALRVALYKFHTLLGGDLANGKRGTGESPKIM